MKPNCDFPCAPEESSRNGADVPGKCGDAPDTNGSSIGSETETDIRRSLDVIQSMIDISADRLEGLRTQCVTSAELTQQEMRSLETKLVRMFTEMLWTKERLPDRPPKSLSGTGTSELKQWLRVVGLSFGTLNSILHRVGTLEVLLEKSEAELKGLLPITNQLDGGCDEEEARRLVRAMNSLRLCRQANEKKKDERLELFWDSWDSRQSNAGPQHHHHGHHGHHHHHHGKSWGSSASPRAVRSHRHHHHHAHHQPQLAKSSTSVAGSTTDGCHSSVQSPIETSPPESYNNSQSSTSAAVHSPAEESSTMSTNLTPSPSPPMSPLALQQQQQQQQQQPQQLQFLRQQQAHSSSPLNHSSSNSSNNNNTNSFANRQGTAANHLVGSSTTTGSGKVLISDAVPSIPPPPPVHGNSPMECGTPTIITAHHGAGGEGYAQETVTVTNGPNNNNNHHHHQSTASQQQQVIMTKSRSHELQLITNDSSQQPGAMTGADQGTAATTTTTGKSSNSSSNPGNGTSGGGVNGVKTPRSRLHTEPGPDEKAAMTTNHNLAVPRSPLSLVNTNTNANATTTGGQTPATGNQVAATLNHDIPHHFTKKIEWRTVTCNFCNRPMFYGLKCKECKYRCHKECEPQVPSSCGLPQQVFDMINSSPNMNRTHGGGGGTLGGGHHVSRRTTQDMIHSKGGASSLVLGAGEGRTGGGPDSSSAGSSCNSSSPSSPALLLGSSGHNYFGSHFQQQHHHNHGHQQPQTPQQGGGFGGHQKPQFMFPEVGTAVGTFEELGLHKGSEMGNSSISVLSESRPPNSPRITLTADREDLGNGNDGTYSQYYNGETVLSPGVGDVGSPSEGNSHGANPAVSGHTANSSHEMTQEEKTGSTMSGSSTNTGASSTESERTPVRLDSTEDRDSMAWPRQNSLSLKEWDIPYDDLRLLEQLGKGRFGTVHRALWHGDVAVKLLKEDYLDDERTLEAFKLEVAIFKKTRHENVVLFMGACMKPPRLAIVTSLCKGKTLYTHIYVCRDKFNLNKATMVAQQISQGMGYLHARGIVHKDLKTKNIFLENGKVIITDFGLFSATKLQYCDRGVEVQENWLCYLAPELIRGLMPVRPTEEDLSFSRASDVYAFGTVWYELLCGEFPFRKVPAESVIWQVGRGMKPTLAHLQASRDVKDILMVCWAFQADDRKDFAALLLLLDRLPKKRLARSPSHPVQLSKSAESVF